MLASFALAKSNLVNSYYCGISSTSQVSFKMSTVKFAPNDWKYSNQVMNTNAEKQRSVSNDVRQASHALRNETDAKTKWEQQNTDKALKLRMGDVTSWRDRVELTLSQTDTEIGALVELKERAQAAYEEDLSPLKMVAQCQELRERRVSIELVRDFVEAELNKEREVIEAIRARLFEKVGEAYDQENSLQDSRNQLQMDLMDKCQALEIDSDTIQLKEKADSLTLKEHYTLQREGVTVDSWNSYSSYNTLKAGEEMRVSAALRDAIRHTIKQTALDLETQLQATNYAFRRRIHETEQSAKELDWQKRNTETEIADIKSEIESLGSACTQKNIPLMIVQTRLDTRRNRPNVELCKDAGEYQLASEGKEIVGSIQALNEKLAVANMTLEELYRTLARVEEDLSIKNYSLQIDRHCLSLRTEGDKGEEGGDPEGAKEELEGNKE